MTTSQLMSATLIYDGAEPQLPSRMYPPGMTPQAALDLIAEKGQMVGTPLERLCEIAGRSCYDSAGAANSRSSAKYHPHINEVKHLSTVEHAAMTVNIHTRRHEDVAEFALMFLNRPNVWVRQTMPYGLRVTLNLRHIQEWDQYKMAVFGDPNRLQALGLSLQTLAKEYAPQIVGAPGAPLRMRDDRPQVDIGAETYATLQRIEPGTDEEKWVSIFMTGSRGFSHEQVRHGDWTAISQRSTRFVDESTSLWVQHPLERAYMLEVHGAPDTMEKDPFIKSAQERYSQVVKNLEPWLISKGVDKTNARKQARGAARGYLGNGLYTEVVFSASCAQWRRMIGQRLNRFADAEIREVYACALPVLKGSRYGDSFADMDMVPSPDGIGQVLKEA